MDQVAVVTGSRGFIGRHLVEALLERGFHVRCVDVKPEPPRDGPERGRVRHYRLDCRDRAALLDSDALDGTDYVFHLAGATRFVNLERFRQANVVPTRNLLEAIATRGIRLRRFVLMSSQAVGGPATGEDAPTRETDTPAPIGFYATSKLEAEHVVREHGDRVPFTILRPSAVYGPGDVDFLQIFRLARLHMSVFTGYADHALSLVFVDDLVRGTVQAAESERTRAGAYFLCSPDPVTWRHIHSAVADSLKTRVLTIHIPVPVAEIGARVGDAYSRITGRETLANSQKLMQSRLPFWICSADAATRDFGFCARVSLAEGLEQTRRWYVEHRWLPA
jgi:nucleoside-diphosphate-sugar epimerase